MNKKTKKKKPSAKTMKYAQGGAMAALADALGNNSGTASGQDGQVAPRGNVVQRVQNFDDPQHGSKGVPMEGKKVEHKQPGTTTMGSPAVLGQTGVTVNTAAQGAAVMTDEERKKKMMSAMMGQQPGMMQFGNPAAAGATAGGQAPKGMPQQGMPPQGAPGMPGMGQEQPASPGPARPYKTQPLNITGDGGLVDPIDAMMAMRRNKRFRKKKNG